MFNSSLQPPSLQPFPWWFLLTWRFFQLKLELVLGHPLSLPLLSSLLLHFQCVRWHHRFCDHFRHRSWCHHFWCHHFCSQHLCGHRFLCSLLRFSFLVYLFHSWYARWFPPSSLQFLLLLRDRQPLEFPR